MTGLSDARGFGRHTRVGASATTSVTNSPGRSRLR